MRRLVWMVLAVLALGGCFGKPGPVEEYLRVSAQAPCETAQAAGKVVTVGVKRFACADALDRQAVMVAHGRVMTPSLRWYWEASPGALSEQAVVTAVNCSTGMAAIWPMRASSEPDFTVSGRVLSFVVREDAKTMEASLELQLWDKNGKSVGTAGTLTVSAPVPVMDGAGIADAGARALRELSDKAAQWLSSRASGRSGS